MLRAASWLSLAAAAIVHHAAIIMRHAVMHAPHIGDARLLGRALSRPGGAALEQNWLRSGGPRPLAPSGACP